SGTRKGDASRRGGPRESRGGWDGGMPRTIDQRVAGTQGFFAEAPAGRCRYIVGMPTSRLAPLLLWTVLLAPAGCAGTGPPPGSLEREVQVGFASYYDSRLHGERTASGER